MLGKASAVTGFGAEVMTSDPIAKMSLDRLLDECTEPEPNTGCYLWTRACNPSGYGALFVGGKFINAHRYVWELANGEPLSDRWVCHRCDQRACVNPDHLYAGSAFTNNHDTRRRGRSNDVGEDNARAVLTETVVRCIRATEGTYKTLAALFGISPTHIRRIKRRESWKQVA